MLSTVTENALDNVRQSFNFEVRKHRLYGPDNQPTNMFGLFRSDNFETVVDQSVTEIYVPHKTEDVVAVTEAAAHAFDGDVDARCHFNKGHYVSVIPTKDYRRAIFGEKDAVFPRIVFRAGYDGRAFKAQIGFYRDLCRNMSMLSKVKGTSFSIVHKGAFRVEMDAMIKQFQTLRESWQTLTGMIERMENSRVNLRQFLQSVYERPSDDAGRASRTRYNNRMEAMYNRLNSERDTSGRPILHFSPTTEVSAWEGYNAVQGYVQHEATRKGDPSDFGRVLKAMEDPAVKRAETLALEAVAAG